MSRRRKKNPILTRIFIGVLVAHAIALPIAAKLGAFEKIQRQFGAAKVVMVNLAPPEQPKRAEQKEKKPQKSEKTVKKAAATTRNTGPQKPNPNQPKVVASTGPATDDNGPTVDANASGKAGEIPKAPAPTQPTTTADKGPGTGGTPAQPPITTPPTPPVKPPTTEPPTKPAEPKPKKFAQVETTFAPEPEIPDDLRSEPFEKTLIVEADVDTSGKPTNVHVAESTGTKELDNIGLDTAKKYRFKPATLDDTAVEGHVRFKIIFKVE